MEPGGPPIPAVDEGGDAAGPGSGTARGPERRSCGRTLARILRWVVGLAAFATVAFAGAATLRWPRGDAAPGPAMEPFRDVRMEASDGGEVRGWYFPAAGSRGAALLLHGYHETSAQMLPLAAALREKGISSLALDFRGHGRSEGWRISFGLREGRDVAAGLSTLERTLLHPRDRLVAIGLSMGASAALFAAEDLQGCAGLVLLAPFASLEEAADRRFRHFLGIPVRPVATPALWLGERIGGFRVGEVRPLDRVREIAPVPLLLVGGEEDDRVPPEEMRRFRDLADEPRELLLVPGLDHFEIGEFERPAVSRPILAFAEACLAGT